MLRILASFYGTLKLSLNLGRRNLELGEKIKMKRMAASLTQQDLADDLFVSRQTISNWELGKSYPDIDSLIRLSDQFSISLDDLLKGDIKMVKSLKIGNVWRILYVISIGALALASGICLLVEYILDRQFLWSLIVIVGCLMAATILSAMKFAVTHPLLKASLILSVLLLPLMVLIQRIAPDYSLYQYLITTGIWLGFYWLILAMWFWKSLPIAYLLALTVILNILAKVVMFMFYGSDLISVIMTVDNVSAFAVAIIIAVLGAFKLDKGKLDKILYRYR
jgi:transcriptional regulator with XRE-family HTH domain